jgi:5-methylcytosine-specific restriction endonuclease McrA
VTLQVVRRDGQICQKCHKPVPDPEVEFDHTIPFSRGGRSTVDNLRVVHRQCNKKKSDSLQDLLHPQPIQQLRELQKSRR